MNRAKHITLVHLFSRLRSEVFSVRIAKPLQKSKIRKLLGSKATDVVDDL